MSAALRSTGSSVRRRDARRPCSGGPFQKAANPRGPSPSVPLSGLARPERLGFLGEFDQRLNFSQFLFLATKRFFELPALLFPGLQERERLGFFACRNHATLFFVPAVEGLEFRELFKAQSVPKHDTGFDDKDGLVLLTAATSTLRSVTPGLISGRTGRRRQGRRSMPATCLTGYSPQGGILLLVKFSALCLTDRLNVKFSSLCYSFSRKI